MATYEGPMQVPSFNRVNIVCPKPYTLTMIASDWRDCVETAV